MNCVNHPDTKSIGICTYCKKAICESCKEEGFTMYYCKSCAGKLGNNIPSNGKPFMIAGGILMVIPFVMFGIGYLTSEGYKGESGFGLIGLMLIGVPLFVIGFFLVGWGWVSNGKK